VIRPGGIVALAFGNSKSIWNGFGADRYPGGLIFHDASKVEEIASQIGLGVVSTRYLHVGGPYTNRLPPVFDRLEALPVLCLRFIMIFECQL
jgi:hypothetical protein